MLRRLKKQVARDVPDRSEERRDCELGEAQRKLYLAELRRSREQVMEAVAQKGLGKSTIHVLAALTQADVDVAAFSVGTPSLDEVFLALTGKTSEHPAAEEER